MDENIIKIKQEQQTKNYIILLEKQIIKLSEKIKKIETKSSFHQNKQLRNEIEQLKMSNIDYPETLGQEIKNLQHTNYKTPKKKIFQIPMPKPKNPKQPNSKNYQNKSKNQNSINNRFVTFIPSSVFVNFFFIIISTL